MKELKFILFLFTIFSIAVIFNNCGNGQEEINEIPIHIYIFPLHYSQEIQIDIIKKTINEICKGNPKNLNLTVYNKEYNIQVPTMDPLMDIHWQEYLDKSIKEIYEVIKSQKNSSSNESIVNTFKLINNFKNEKNKNNIKIILLGYFPDCFERFKDIKEILSDDQISDSKIELYWLNYNDRIFPEKKVLNLLQNNFSITKKDNTENLGICLKSVNEIIICSNIKNKENLTIFKNHINSCDFENTQINIYRPGNNSENKQFFYGDKEDAISYILDNISQSSSCNFNWLNDCINNLNQRYESGSGLTVNLYIIGQLPDVPYVWQSKLKRIFDFSNFSANNFHIILALMSSGDGYFTASYLASELDKVNSDCQSLFK